MIGSSVAENYCHRRTLDWTHCWPPFKASPGGWADTVITLPDDAAAAEWLDMLTGVKLSSEGKRLPADTLVANLLVASLLKLT